MREYHYRVDREGRIFHEESEILDPFVLRFFLRAMTRTPDGRYLVLCQDEHNWFAPHDTPFVVQRLRPTVRDGRLDAVELCFAGDHREPLDPGSLETEDGHLFCRVRRGAFRARFGRVAMQQLAPFLAEDGGEPALLLARVRHPISSPTPVTIQGKKRNGTEGRKVIATAETGMRISEEREWGGGGRGDSPGARPR